MKLLRLDQALAVSYESSRQFLFVCCWVTRLLPSKIPSSHMSNECSFMKRIASCQACLIEVIGASRHLVHSRLAGVNAASACCTCWNVKRLKMVRVNLLWFQIAELVWPDNMHSSGGIKCDLWMWSLWPVAGCVFVVYQMQYNHCLCFSLSLSHPVWIWYTLSWECVKVAACPSWAWNRTRYGSMDMPSSAVWPRRTRHVASSLTQEDWR